MTRAPLARTKSNNRKWTHSVDGRKATLALLDWLHKLRPSKLSWPALPQPHVISQEATETIDASQHLREQLVTSAEAGDYLWLAGENFWSITGARRARCGGGISNDVE